jgi:putative membrane protein
MMVHTPRSVIGMLRWQRGNVRRFLLASGVVWGVWWLVPELGELLPVTPVAVVGGAIGIFVSFRTNSAYDRWWEGRKLWGRMINVSRHFTSQVLTYLPAEQRDLQVEVLHRHAAYVHTLRCLLRKQNPVKDDEVLALVSDDERDTIPDESNATHYLLHRTQVALVEAANGGHIDGHRLESLDRSLFEMLSIQGGCERIKKTPMPRGYGFMAELLVEAYAWLLPLALVQEMGVLVIPTTALVCLSFALISEAGRVLEDPFTMFWNGLPLSAMSRGIERDLRRRLGEELPPALQPDANGVLM